MNRYGRGASKASSTTLCQKCLKRGHYSYECKSQTQERPYQSRPSRTQQLLNPRLKPKLSNVALEEPMSNKTITDKILDTSVAKLSMDRKRSRSSSSHSSTSVSTISTRSSHSPPALSHTRDIDMVPHGQEKRRRRGSSASRLERDGSEQAHAGAESGRRTRLRRRSTSPAERGRRRSRSTTADSRYRDPDTRTLDRKRADYEDSKQQDRPVDVTENNHSMKDAYDDPTKQARDRSRQRSLSPYSKRVQATMNMRT